MANDEKGVTGLLGDRQQLLDRLAEQTRRFELALANSAITVFEQDRDLVYTWVYNPAQNESPAAIIGKTDAEMLDPVVAARLDALKRQVLETGEPLRTEVTAHPPGTPAHHFDLQIEARRDAGGTITGITCAAFDITERKAAEAALAASEARYRLLFEQSVDGICVIDDEGLVVDVNLACCRLFGLERDDFIGRGVRSLLDPGEGTRLDAAWTELESGGAIAGEWQLLRRDGSSFTGEVSGRRLEGGLFHGIVRDVTERKRHDTHVALLMRELDHRARNMLTLVEAVARRTIARGPEDFTERFSKRIQSLAANQDLLVRSSWRAVPLDELVRSQLAFLGDLSGTRITMAGPAVEITPAASQTLGMAIHELATNAVKHGALSVPGGRVRIGWAITDVDANPRFAMEWRESEGPAVAAPAELGFGSTVLRRMVGMAFGCDAELSFAAAGFGWRIDCRAEAVLEAESLRALVMAG